MQRFFWSSGEHPQAEPPGRNHNISISLRPIWSNVPIKDNEVCSRHVRQDRLGLRLTESKKCSEPANRNALAKLQGAEDEFIDDGHPPIAGDVGANGRAGQVPFGDFCGMLC